MRVAILLFLVLSFQSAVFAQQHLQEEITHKIDSVFALIARETNQDTMVKRMLSIHTLRLQSFPTIYLETGQKLNRMALASGNVLMEANSWTLLGQGYRLSGNYVKGLECHHKAISLAEQTHNEGLIGIAYNELGHIYKDREENEKALKIYQNALSHLVKSKIPEVRTWPEMNLSAIYLAMQKPDSAIYYSERVLQEWKTKPLGASTSYAYLNLAGAYSQKHNNPSAMQYYHEGLRQAERDSSARYKNYLYMGMAEHYLRNAQPDSSIFFARKAVSAVENTAFTFLSIKPAKLLAELFETISPDSALKYMRIFRVANDSLFNTRSNQQLQMMEFEEEQRKFELTMERREYRNKIRMYFLLGALAIFTIAAIILLRNNRQKQKVNAQLHKQKEELQTTLSQLKNTQTQLIQAEKMASLGELTAGIAHEIQNPLNFVNNFSEVNAELVDELLAELATGNGQLAKEIAGNIKENEEKIVFHGKRADAIVKSMLQHSRASTGQKEMTDINALVDEYVRLAFHGMRAKDNSFNTDLQTDFDPAVGKATIVSQDIGRVILNIITNAFHAVAQKSKMSIPGYQPRVSVTTKKTNDKIEVRIADNGPGIPPQQRNKIFQPFFTTKPAGQGTGLGLSISYDIVKAHGGELNVETREGEGTSFVIVIPA